MPAARFVIKYAILVIVALIVLEIVMLLVPVDRPASASLSREAPADGSPAFLQALAAATHTSVENGDTVTSIVGGAAFEKDLLGAIQTATSSILITDYPWNNGSFTDNILSALTAAISRGVKVRVIIDDLGARYLSESWIEKLRNVGGDVVIYHPFNIADPLGYNVRDHTRVFVIDTNIGFTGGVGLRDYWVEDSEGYSTWQDLMFETRGNMTTSLIDDFAALWKESSGENLDISVPSISSTVMTGGATSSIRYVSIFGTPVPNVFEPVRYAFLRTAMGAQKKLYIESAYILPDQDFLSIIEQKARSGVDVRIIFPGAITSAPTLRSAWQADFGQLLAAGVRLYGYEPSMIHSKMMVADDDWSLIGSANLDDRSESINVESVLGIADPVLAGKLDAIFMNDMEHSQEITEPDWDMQYGFFARLQSRFWNIFARQM